MGYRKIKIDSTTYEFVIGVSHVKVKGLGVWPKSEVGKIRVRESSKDNPFAEAKLWVSTQDVVDKIKEVTCL